MSLQPANTWRPMDPVATVMQIGRGNIAAISGGRVAAIRDEDGDVVGVRLPVAHGYRVDVLLHPSDTYTVRRVFARGGTEWVKGEWREVYAEDLGEAAYVASCYVNRTFGAHVPAGAVS